MRGPVFLSPSVLFCNFADMKPKSSLHLRVALDAKRALRNSTGLGNYSRYTILQMALHFPSDTFVMYAAGGPNAMSEKLTELPNVELCGPQSEMMRRLPTWWRTLEVGRQALADGCDLYHGLSNEIPINSSRVDLPTVVTIHDVIWRRCPSDYKAVDRAVYDYKYGTSARQADIVIAISERTRADLVQEFNIDPAKIRVIYQGVDAMFAPVGSEAVAAVRAKYGLPERYIACVGTVQGRKNQLLAVKGLRALPADVKLVIVGRRTDYAKELDSYIASKGLRDRVVWLEGIPFADLPAIYTGARAAAYVSRYEGFGLPVVEALRCGTPVIAATGSCLEEAGGRGAIYVGPDDVGAYAEAALRLVDDAYFRDKTASLGQRHLRTFSDSEFARKTMAAYQLAILNHYSDGLSDLGQLSNK